MLVVIVLVCLLGVCVLIGMGGDSTVEFIAPERPSNPRKYL